jgi:hypothetical protein
MKKAILVATIAAMTVGVNAGDWGKAPVGKAPIEECVDLGGSISAGYMSDYIFYGVQFAGDSVWTDVNYTFDNLAVPITVGAWYLNGINDDGGAGSGAEYDELDLYVSAALGTFAGFDVALGYTHFVFPEYRSNNPGPNGSYGEIGLDITRSLGFVDIAWNSNYALGGGGASASGWYHQLGFEKSFGVTDSISLVLGAGVGYSDGYFDFVGATGSGWNHYYVTASLPIALNCRTTLTPYIGYNGAPDTWIADGINVSSMGIDQSDILHGGVTLSVSF